MAESNGAVAVDNEDTRCRLCCCFRPAWGRWLAGRNMFMVCYGLAGIAQGMLFTYYVAVASSIETHFQLPSEAMGLVMSIGEIVPIFTALIFSYFFGAGDRPRWLAFSLTLAGLGCHIIVFPYYIFGADRDRLIATNSSDTGNSTNDVTRLCGLASPNIGNYNATFGRNLSTDKECQVNYSQENNVAAVALCVVGYTIFNIGATLMWVIGTPYLDDNVQQKNSPIYLAISACIRTIGPVLGFVLSSVCLNVFVSPGEENGLTSTDPKWIGAWWLGYVVMGTVAFLFAFIIGQFPKRLPSDGITPAMELEMAEFAEKQQKLMTSGKHEADKKRSDIPPLKELLPSLRRLSTNVLLMSRICSKIFTWFGVVGYMVYTPKYFEHQFSMTASQASVWTASNTSLSDDVSLQANESDLCQAATSGLKILAQQQSCSHLRKLWQTPSVSERRESQMFDADSEGQDGSSGEEAEIEAILNLEESTESEDVGDLELDRNVQQEMKEFMKHFWSRNAPYKRPKGKNNSNEQISQRSESSSTGNSIAEMLRQTSESSRASTNSSHAAAVARRIAENAVDSVEEESDAFILAMLLMTIPNTSIPLVLLVTMIIATLFTMLARRFRARHQIHPVPDQTDVNDDALGFFEYIFGYAFMIPILIGQLVVGLILQRFQPTARRLAAAIGTTKLLYAVAIALLILLHCEGSKVQGSDFGARYPACELSCSCGPEDFKPVCSYTGETYFSPCHAGCSQQIFDNTTKKLAFYDECLCVQEGVVKPSQCEEGCDNTLAYVILSGIGQFLLSVEIIGGLIFTLRCIETKDKTLAMGLISALLGIFTFFPCPLVFAAIVDGACAVWAQSCGQTGACLVYDVDKFRWLQHAVPAVLLLVGCMWDALMWWKCKDLSLFGEEDGTKDAGRGRPVSWSRPRAQ